MKLLIDVGHPAHVHFFKNMIWNLEKNGHEVYVTARDKEVTKDLLEFYDIPHKMLGRHSGGVIKKMTGLVKTDIALYRFARSFKPDIFLGLSSPYAAHVSRITGKPSITFADTEGATIVRLLTFPFTDVICTPSCFMEGIDPKKHLTFNGYKELAYLHPKYFKPDYTVLENLGVSKEENPIVLRFISWQASHDYTLKGISDSSVSSIIKDLEKQGRVFITSERKLPRVFDKYRFKIHPSKMHSLLYFSKLYIGEGGTMTTEAAILGTPSIHIESDSKGKATGEASGNFLELRDKYKLLFMFANYEDAMVKAKEILENKTSKKAWQYKREKLLSEKIDVTKWMTNFIENYPDSFHKLKNKRK